MNNKKIQSQVFSSLDFEVEPNGYTYLAMEKAISRTIELMEEECAVDDCNEKGLTTFGTNEIKGITMCDKHLQSYQIHSTARETLFLDKQKADFRKMIEGFPFYKFVRDYQYTGMDGRVDKDIRKELLAKLGEDYSQGASTPQGRLNLDTPEGVTHNSSPSGTSKGCGNNICGHREKSHGRNGCCRHKGKDTNNKLCPCKKFQEVVKIPGKPSGITAKDNGFEAHLSIETVRSNALASAIEITKDWDVKSQPVIFDLAKSFEQYILTGE